MELPIYLIGYMASGKTTVGKLLAEKLGWHFVDLDDAFAELYGYTTGEYIRQFGLDAFRKKEKACVEMLSELPIQKVIYATGGGYPCWEDNMECLKELGTSFYLRWKPEQLTKRLFLSGIDQRPVAKDGMMAAEGSSEEEKMLHFVQQHLADRVTYYEQAHFIIDAPDQLHESNDEVMAEQIYRIISQHYPTGYAGLRACEKT